MKFNNTKRKNLTETWQRKKKKKVPLHLDKQNFDQLQMITTMKMLVWNIFHFLITNTSLIRFCFSIYVDIVFKQIDI